MFCFFAGAKQTGKKDDFRLRPAIGGEQNGWFDAEGLPTALKINDQWVLPRGGTMEWLMKKGYVPDSERKNVMVPNPFDKRYKVPRRIYLPSLATRPVDFINTGISPRFKKSNDPFEGLADPMKRKYAPLSGAGASPGLPGQKNELGPVLDPEENLPTLDGTPFAPPARKPGLNVTPNPLDGPKPSPNLPDQDPFADELDNPVNPPRPPGKNLNELPGKPVEIVPLNDNPFIPVKPNA
ncbi:MAG: hypothetical protein HN531_08090 [Opitutae bacterium]|nr:hypothetical protein [Opitutae bacterium]